MGTLTRQFEVHQHLATNDLHRLLIHKNQLSFGQAPPTGVPNLQPRRLSSHFDQVVFVCMLRELATS